MPGSKCDNYICQSAEPPDSAPVKCNHFNLICEQGEWRGDNADGESWKHPSCQRAWEAADGSGVITFAIFSMKRKSGCFVSWKGAAVESIKIRCHFTEDHDYLKCQLLSLKLSFMMEHSKEYLHSERLSLLCKSLSEGRCTSVDGTEAHRVEGVETRGIPPAAPNSPLRATGIAFGPEPRPGNTAMAFPWVERKRFNMAQGNTNCTPKIGSHMIPWVCAIIVTMMTLMVVIAIADFNIQASVVLILFKLILWTCLIGL